MNCKFVPTGKIKRGKRELICRKCKQMHLTNEEPDRVARMCNARYLFGIKGLGDLIYVTLYFSGVHKVVELLVKRMNINCGCYSRQLWLNRKVPFPSFKPRKKSAKHRVGGN